MPEVEISLMRAEDIDDVRHMQALVWQDHFLKEKGKEVPLLYRSRQNLSYYLHKKGGRAFLARSDGVIVGSIICHIWGGMGWFGPLEVLPEHQGRGIGKRLVSAGMDYLHSNDCTITGLETMTSSPRNVGFYTKQGFAPKQLSYVLFKDLTDAVEIDGRELPPSREVLPSDIPILQDVWNKIDNGLDYLTEIESLKEFELGEARIFPGTGEFPNHVILHTYELIDGSRNSIVKLLVAEDVATAKRILDWCSYKSAEMGKIGMFMRFYQGNALTLEDLLNTGFVLTGTLVRMLMRGEDSNTEMVHVSCWSG